MGNAARVIRYYKSLESRLGYTFMTWDTKHFGYYPSQKADISEKAAQINMMDLVAKNLSLKRNERVLDAGCGRGTTSCHFATMYGARVTGIDIVSFELDIASKKAASLDVDHTPVFKEASYLTTGFPDNHFDKIFTLETFVHTPDKQKTLKELYRILNPGGRLAMFEYTRAADSEFTPYELEMFFMICEYSEMPAFRTMFHDGFKPEIERAGFIVTAAEDISAYMLPSLERFRRYAIYPYRLISLFDLKRHFINTTAGVECYSFVKNGCMKYRVFTGTKPISPHKNRRRGI